MFYGSQDPHEHFHFLVFQASKQYFSHAWFVFSYKVLSGFFLWDKRGGEMLLVGGRNARILLLGSITYMAWLMSCLLPLALQNR